MTATTAQISFINDLRAEISKATASESAEVQAVFGVLTAFDDEDGSWSIEALKEVRKLAQAVRGTPAHNLRTEMHQALYDLLPIAEGAELTAQAGYVAHHLHEDAGYRAAFVNALAPFDIESGPYGALAPERRAQAKARRAARDAE